jgi:hypothetical protein
MWLTLFSVTAAVVLALGAVAFALQPRPTVYAKPSTAGSPQSSGLLLLWRMRTLGLDPEEIAGSEPALFRQLEARCRGCVAKERCRCDLAFDVDDERSGWRDYCPNGPVLNMLSILQGCYHGLRKYVPGLFERIERRA